ncbi:MAG: hypothetical protein LBQ12_02480 [Deltaproteobacteria bacterium]|jgi:hypothetical protein|nr:hypothetical protein [Deltaproteobacteria bacterium]
MKTLTIIPLLAAALALTVSSTSCIYPGGVFPLPGASAPPLEEPDPDNPPVFVRGNAPAGSPGYAAPRVANMSGSFQAMFRDQPQLTQGEVDQYANYLAGGRRGALPGGTKARQQYIAIKITNALWMLSDPKMTSAKMEQQYRSALPVPTPSELSLVRKNEADLNSAMTGKRR